MAVEEVATVVAVEAVAAGRERPAAVPVSPVARPPSKRRQSFPPSQYSTQSPSSSGEQAGEDTGFDTDISSSVGTGTDTGVVDTGVGSVRPKSTARYTSDAFGLAAHCHTPCGQ